MFASQLLRILQTLPADVKYEPCAFETAELKVKMKENQNRIQRHSDGYGEEPDSLSFTTKDFHFPNGHGKDVDHLALQTRERDDFWNIPELDHSAVVDNFTKDTETEFEIPPKQEDQTARLYPLSGCEKDGNPLTSDRKNGDELWNIPELECSMIMENDFVSSNKQESQNSGAPFITSSELFPSDTHLSTHKNMMESELPKLIVCYKEINYHVVKDICIDEGMPDEGKRLVDRVCVSQPADECRQNETGGDFASRIPAGSRASSKDDIDNHAAGKCETKEGEAVSLVPGKLTSSPDGSISKESRSPQDLKQACEMKCTPNKIANGVPEEESIVTSMLPLKKFGTRSFLRSFMDSLNKNGDEAEKHPNQGLPMEANLESLDSVSKVEKSNTNSRTKELVYDSKAENVTITFDFNSSKSAAADSWCTGIESIEQSQKSDDALVGLDSSSVDIHQQSSLKNGNSNGPFIGSEVQSTSGSTENIHQEIVLNNTKWKSNNPFAVDEVPRVTIDGSSENIDQMPMLNHKGNFNPFTFSEVETASMSNSSKDIHQPSVLNAMKGNSNNPFAVNEVQNARMNGDSRNIPEQPVLNQKIGKTTNLFPATVVQSYTIGGSTGSIHPQPELKHNNSNSCNPFATLEVQSDRIDGSTGNSHENPLNTISFTDQAESSFSAAGPVTGLITYSGPITHSGSTSVRSDSSTTSTRSFAFPVLQPEWNSSPVRMGKADGRHLRKHRGWKQGAWRALCCSGRFIG